MGCDFRVSVSGSHGGKGDVQRTPALWGRLHLPPEEGRGGATSPRGGDRKPLAAPSRRIQWSLTPPPYALLKMELNSFMWVPPTSGPAHRYSRLEHFHPVSLMIFCSKAVSEESYLRLLFFSTRRQCVQTFSRSLPETAKSVTRNISDSTDPIFDDTWVNDVLP